MKEHEIALQEVKKVLKRGEPFYYEELADDILMAGGILRIGVGFTLGDYIKELEEDGIIRFNPQTTKYDVL